MIGVYTVPQGQRVSVWAQSGRRTIVDGPRRLLLWGTRVERLQSFVASPTQYLIIQHRDGRTLHRRGPVMVWMDPVEHSSVTVADAITLDANEALVVYRQLQGKVDRRVVRGPELFVPDSQEWLHEFRWHGADPREPRRKIPRGLVFTQLRVIPDQMYFDVESVRTADDALLAVKLMVFYELIDIERMLDQTHDPIADFINAVGADVIDFAVRLSFEQFKEQTGRLNDLETYPQLVQRAGRIGYQINKVVYRGYEATAKLQTMHDGAIEARTRLKLEAETERKSQELADLKLAREQERSQKRQKMERAEVEHQNFLKRIGHDETLREQQSEQELQRRQQQAQQEQQLAVARQNSEMRAQFRQVACDQRLAFLKAVQAMQVDLTRYLVARHERPDRRIRLEGDHQAQLHLHG